MTAATDAPNGIDGSVEVDGSSFSFAFQPIIDTRTGRACSHEALVRGLNNEPAFRVIEQYTGKRLAPFDSACRARALEVAVRIGMTTSLNLNFLPSAALGAGAGLTSTVDTCNRLGFSLDRIIIEATEVEAINDQARFARTIREFRREGIRFAIDDFGSGYAGLTLLAEFQPDSVKLDMALVRGIQSDGPRQAIARAVAQVCTDLGIDLIVEGVETMEEFRWFADIGVHLYQGYLFAKPAFEAIPSIVIPDP